MRKIFVSGDLGVVDLSYHVAGVFVNPSEMTRITTLDELRAFVGAVLHLDGSALATLDALTPPQAVSIVQAMSFEFVKYVVHGKALATSQFARTSPAARLAAEARATHSRTLTRNAGLDTTSATRYTAYVDACVDSYGELASDAYARAAELRGARLLRHRHHALDTAANAPFAAASLLVRRLGLNLDPKAVRDSIFNVVGNPTFASRAVRGHRPVPAKALVRAYGERLDTFAGDEYMTSQANILFVIVCRFVVV